MIKYGEDVLEYLFSMIEKIWKKEWETGKNGVTQMEIHKKGDQQ